MCALFLCRQTQNAAGSREPHGSETETPDPKPSLPRPAKVMKSYPKTSPTGFGPKPPAGPPPAKCGDQSTTSKPTPVKAMPVQRKAMPVEKPEEKLTLPSGKPGPPAPPRWTGPLPEPWWPPPPPPKKSDNDDDDDDDDDDTKDDAGRRCIFKLVLLWPTPNIYICIHMHCMQVSGDDIFPGGRIKAGAT